MESIIRSSHDMYHTWCDLLSYDITIGKIRLKYQCITSLSILFFMYEF